jgi:hypothetical protein
MKSVLGALLTSLLLVACGGGGSGGGTSGGSAGASSPGTISSGCGSGGNIFIDCLNKDWGAFQVWENNAATGQGQGYKTESNASNVQWKLADSAAAGHGKVVEVTYGQKTGYESQFYVNTDPVDRSAYATGKLSFDINVQSYGDAYDYNKAQMLFDVIVECVWPCLSHSVKVPVNILNQWQTVGISIADLVRDGLDLKRVDTALLIRPSIDHGAQTGVKFQLDNIKWEKGTGSVAAPKEVYAEHFNTLAAADNWKFVSYEGGVTEIHKHLSQGLGTFPEWRTSFDHWALETVLANAISIQNKKVSMQVKLRSAIVSGYASPIEFALVATDSAGRTVSTERFSSSGMMDVEWYTLKTTLGSSFPNGFNADNVKKLGFHVYATGTPFAYGYINIDTIRITE